jgi:hypothetical protein
MHVAPALSSTRLGARYFPEDEAHVAESLDQRFHRVTP